jgi:ERCC4-related helicase
VSQKLSQPSTNFNTALKALLWNLLNGFRYHPYIFMLRQSPEGKDAAYPYTHQVELLYRLFARKPLKALIGDEIGLGKTIEAIMLLKYLQEVGEVKRALILVPRILVNQWESELRRFGIEPLRVERDTIGTLVARGFPEGVYLASIDLVKREKYKQIVLDIKWDIVVVDEAHRVGIVGGKKNARYLFLEELIHKNPSINVVLLSATPHRGKVDDYIQRLKLVDPYLRAKESELDTEDFYKRINNALVFRRTKLDVNEIYEKAPVFKPCEFIAYVVEASEEEKKFHDLLISFLRSKLLEYYSRTGKEPKGLALLLTLIAKRASSSPEAALKTFSRILMKRSAILEGEPEEALREVEKKADEIIDSLFTSFEDYGEVFDEVEEGVAEDIDDIVNTLTEFLGPLLSRDDPDKLRHLIDLAQEIKLKDSRLTEVINLVKDHLSKGDRVVIFTEFKDTAEYVYNALLKALPPLHRDKVCLVTATRIEPPKILRELPKARKYGIEDVKNWLKKGLVDVIVSTDVASEGLNLQYANVVIHYEPTWSPIKIVQRIGRIWRVGQEKNVYSYNVLLAVENDLAVFENLYGKLLSWLIAGVESKVVIGEKLKISFLKEEEARHERVDIFAMPVTGDREVRGYSEYRAILEFIRRGKKGLETYIDQILSLLQQLKQVSKKVESERIDKSIFVENIVSAGLGGLSRKEAEEALLKVLESLAKVEGCSIDKKSSRVYVDCPNLGVVTSIESIADMYRVIVELVKSAGSSEPVILLATALNDENVKELHLFEVSAKLGNRVVYSEVIGLTGAKAEPIRGAKLLNLIAKVMPNIIGVADSIQISDSSTHTNMELKARTVVSGAIRKYIVSLLGEYIRFVEGNGLSEKHKDWIPATGSISVDAKWIGSVLFISSDTGKEAPPPIKVEEVEKRAMEFVIEFERSSGRVPEDVSKYEHYDVRSYDPRTGEVRYIEVKGRWEPTLVVELTEDEFKYAKNLGKSYWLYIVYDIGSGKPKLVMVRDPVNNVVWQPIPEYRYRVVGIKREAAETV